MVALNFLQQRTATAKMLTPQPAADKSTRAAPSRAAGATRFIAQMKEFMAGESGGSTKEHVAVRKLLQQLDAGQEIKSEPLGRALKALEVLLKKPRPDVHA